MKNSKTHKGVDVHWLTGVQLGYLDRKINIIIYSHEIFSFLGFFSFPL